MTKIVASRGSKFCKIALFLLTLAITSAFAPESHLKNPENEAKAQKLFTEIRCLSCEAQSIAGSNTAFSKSMRKIIRQKIKQGKNEQEIKAELKKEFGNQIFMSAAIQSNKLPWIAPLIFAIISGLILVPSIKKIIKPTRK